MPGCGDRPIYVGTALTATSVGIGVQVLQQFGLVESQIGRIVLAAAVLDDVVALYLIAITHGILSEGLEPTRIAGSIVLAILLLTTVFLVCRLFARGLRVRAPKLHGGYRLAAAIVLIVASAWLTDLAGLSPVVGAFFAGLGLGDGFEDPWRDGVRRGLNPLVLCLILFFFVLIGFHAQWSVLTAPGMVSLPVGLSIVAIGGKTVGGMVGAFAQGIWLAVC